MAKKVLVLDTSILCCWLKVPGKDTAGTKNDKWDFNRIDDKLKAERLEGSTFVLPLASLIETGNHISQCSGDRFKLARVLTDYLNEAVNASSPWVAFTDQSLLWESANLQQLAIEWPKLAVGGTSIGDATIKHVAEYYSKAGYKVEIMTGDDGLKSYEIRSRPVSPRRRS